MSGKETHFFKMFYESRGLDRYRALFRGALPTQLLMEGTPDYGMSNHFGATMARMAKDIPTAKLIYIVRDPAERVASHYVQMLSNTRSTLPFEDALTRWPEILRTSDYEQVLSVVYAYFPPVQVLVLFLDDYNKDARGVHARVLSFLELEASESMLEVLGAQGQLHTRAGG